MDDPEQGLGSLILGAGSDWDWPNPPSDMSDEDYQRLSNLAKEMSFRVGQEVNRIFLESYEKSLL